MEVETIVRRTIAATLALAFLLAFLAPAHAGWSCPDGTPCVHDRHQGFVCAGEKCAAHAASCCVVKTTRCKHGAAPDSEPGAWRPALQAPDHCRYHVTAVPKLVAVAEAVRFFPVTADGVSPAPAIQLLLPAFRPVWRSEYTLGYRPPPSLLLGPCRAPPTA